MLTDPTMKDRANSASRSDPAASMMVTDRLMAAVELAQFLKAASIIPCRLISQHGIPVLHISSGCVRFRRQLQMTWIESLTQKAKT
jgi:hypothetical protein